MNIVLDVLRYLNEHGITLVRAAEATGVAQQNIKKSIGNNPKTSTELCSSVRRRSIVRIEVSRRGFWMRLL